MTDHSAAPARTGSDRREAPGPDQRFVSFLLDGQRYAIDILVVREVHRPLGITPARGPHAFVRGMVNLRGQIITILDPALRLGLAPRTGSEDSRLVILKSNPELRARGILDRRTTDDAVALWVDRISDVVLPGPRGVEAPSAAPLTGLGGEYLAGVIQLEREVVRILDPEALVAVHESAGAL